MDYVDKEFVSWQPTVKSAVRTNNFVMQNKIRDARFYIRGKKQALLLLTCMCLRGNSINSPSLDSCFDEDGRGLLLSQGAGG